MRLPLRLRPHHLLSTFIVLTFSLPFPSLFQTYKLWMFLQSDRISGISFSKEILTARHHLSSLVDEALSTTPDMASTKLSGKWGSGIVLFTDNCD